MKVKVTPTHAYGRKLPERHRASTVAVAGTILDELAGHEGLRLAGPVAATARNRAADLDWKCNDDCGI